MTLPAHEIIHDFHKKIQEIAQDRMNDTRAEMVADALNTSWDTSPPSTWDDYAATIVDSFSRAMTDCLSLYVQASREDAWMKANNYT